jgi:hypothetical protein
MVGSTQASGRQFAVERLRVQRHRAVREVRGAQGADSWQVGIVRGDLADFEWPRPVVADVVVEGQQRHRRSRVEIAGRLSEVDLEHYRVILSGDRVIVTGRLTPDRDRVVATSVQRI